MTIPPVDNFARKALILESGALCDRTLCTPSRLRIICKTNPKPFFHRPDRVKGWASSCFAPLHLMLPPWQFYHHCVKLSDASKKLGKKFATGASVVKCSEGFMHTRMRRRVESLIEAPDRAKPGMEDGKNAAQSRSFKRLVCNQFNVFSKTILMKLVYSC
ncbi:hypothetical protein DVH24_021996 [Malus domestica]|uniref:Uncharacterized protein n=1 Tax=Malus domestica TaxID=3750 RepID=A0A498IYY5_MALDO|nr:hypothetical protein DVH24_021996 [Malus domestica]